MGGDGAGNDATAPACVTGDGDAGVGGGAGSSLLLEHVVLGVLELLLMLVLMVRNHNNFLQKFCVLFWVVFIVFIAVFWYLGCA